MTWEQKLAALKAVCPTHLEMRAPGDWYVAAFGRERPRRGMLDGIYGNGKTPEAAVEDDWRQVANGEPIVTDAYRETRKCVRWNGYMWEPVKEER